MSDFIALLNQRVLPKWVETSAVPRIESAQVETEKLEQELDDVRDLLAKIQEDLPAPNVAVSELRQRLGGFEERFAEVGQRLEETKQEFLGLMPDSMDLAYLRIARAEVAEVRGLVARHLEDHDRRSGAMDRSQANRRAWVALALSTVGVAVAVFTALR